MNANQLFCWPNNASPQAKIFFKDDVCHLSSFTINQHPESHFLSNRNGFQLKLYKKFAIKAVQFDFCLKNRKKLGWERKFLGVEEEVWGGRRSCKLYLRDIKSGPQGLRFYLKNNLNVWKDLFSSISLNQSLPDLVLKGLFVIESVSLYRYKVMPYAFRIVVLNVLIYQQQKLNYKSLLALCNKAKTAKMCNLARADQVYVRFWKWRFI